MTGLVPVRLVVLISVIISQHSYVTLKCSNVVSFKILRIYLSNVKCIKVSWVNVLRIINISLPFIIEPTPLRIVCGEISSLVSLATTIPSSTLVYGRLSYVTRLVFNSLSEV